MKEFNNNNDLRLAVANELFEWFDHFWGLALKELYDITEKLYL